MRLIDVDELESRICRLYARPKVSLLEVLSTIGHTPTIAYIEAGVDVLIKAVPTWISVKDRPPEDGGRYIVWADDHIETADYWGDGKWANHDYGVMISGVTHWMPLPEKPIDIERY